MKAFVNAYQQKGKATVVSSPHVVTANHREAIFKTGEKVPLIESTRPSTNGPINSYKVEEVGLQLKVTPHINRSGDIDMQVYQTIDAITNMTIPINTISDRTVETVRLAFLAVASFLQTLSNTRFKRFSKKDMIGFIKNAMINPIKSTVTGIDKPSG